MRQTNGRADASEEALLRLVQDHAAELLRLARRFSLCADDAHDAYQRSLEILVRRMRSDSPPVEPLGWVKTVLRHEALRVRAERQRLVDREEPAVERHVDAHAEDPAERAAGHERLSQVAEALRRLKPQEVTALVLRAEGLSYKEICTRMSWSYTKTNRSVTEGRRALLRRLGAIESGAECSRWLPLLSALADGEASARDLAELRPHLRACSACRATLRELHDAPRQVAALVPVALVPLAGDHGGLALRHVEALAHAVLERATLTAARVQGAFEAAPGTKLAAVAASTAAIAGGGAAIQHTTHAHAQPAPAVEASAPAAGGTVRSPWPTASGTPPRSGSSPQRVVARRRRASERRSGGEFTFERGSPAPAARRSGPASPPARAAAVVSSPPPAKAPPAATEFRGPLTSLDHKHSGRSHRCTAPSSC